MATGILIIYSSPNGRDDWAPVRAKDVPAWVKGSDTLGRLVDGEIACNAADGNAGSAWYRAERIQPEMIK